MASVGKRFGGLFGAVAIACSLMGCASSTEHRDFSLPTPALTEDGRTTADLVAAIAAGDAGKNELAQLRRRGPEALDALLAAFDSERLTDKSTDPARVARLKAAIDHVAQQKDADVSRLYWYTDLEEAKRVASKSSKPILSLRLLGRLDEELSCANSRFFRTALYGNAKVSAALREHFVLHWSTEREAPIVTIDFRDGRKVSRTITGNSIHYVLDAEGRVLDSLPGLYGPLPFLAALGDAEALGLEVSKLEDSAAQERIRAHHRERAEGLETRWSQETTQLGYFNLAAPVPVKPVNAALPPPAMLAMPLAAGKAVVEMPIVSAMEQRPLPRMRTSANPTDNAFEKMAANMIEEVRLDAQSRELLARKRPMDWSTGEPKPLQAEQLDAVVGGFENLMALDTVKNEYRFHARLHTWLAEGSPDMASLNARVYEELFLTPASDPWLGLVPPQIFTGLDADGLLPTASKP